MGFMQPQVTGALDWVYVDTCQGGYYFMSESAGSVPDDEDEAKAWAADLVGLSAEDVYGVGMSHGHGARLSAPGYMDCTEWTVHNTVAEAAQYLLVSYYDGCSDSEPEVLELNRLMKESK